jgi:hypothetical protein
MNAIGWHPAGMQNVFVWLTGGVALLNHRLMAANPVGFAAVNRTRLGSKRVI